MRDSRVSLLMRNLRIDVEYDGNGYHGWQYQPNSKTIQEVIEETVFKITQERSTIIGAGRTDAGVHAQGQVANFHTQSTLDVHSFRSALNSLLPRDIVVKKVTEARLSFHARKDAIKKRYEYWILNGPVSSAFYYRYSWYIRYPLDMERMKMGSLHLLGQHDFSSFRASGCECGSSAIRTISNIDFTRYTDGRIRLGLEANAFLRCMARVLVGTLVDVARGRIEESAVSSIMEARDRRRAGKTAPPHGLFLKWVLYSPGADMEGEKSVDGVAAG